LNTSNPASSIEIHHVPISPLFNGGGFIHHLSPLQKQAALSALSTLSAPEFGGFGRMTGAFCCQKRGSCHPEGRSRSPKRRLLRENNRLRCRAYAMRHTSNSSETLLPLLLFL
jgi:hypothetical protein